MELPSASSGPTDWSDNTIEYRPSLEDYLRIAKRRWLWFLLPFILILVVSIVVVLFLPQTYRSTGKIGVESQQIPEDIVRSTITTLAGERVGLIQQRVMTTYRLEQIINDLDLYPEDRKRLTTDALVKSMVEAIDIDVIVDSYARQLGAIAFTVSFAHKDPEKAQSVATRLVELFLEENAKSRTARAAETTEFLERQAKKLGDKARAVDTEIAAFKRKHRDALPEHLGMKLGLLSSAESGLDSVETEITSLEQEQRYLTNQRQSLATILTRRGDLNLSESSPSELQLDGLRAELATLLASYKPIHPDVRALQAEIASLEEHIRSGAATPVSQRDPISPNPVLLNIDSQLRTVTNRLQVLREQLPESKARVTELQGHIAEIPLVEVKLRQLGDRYDLVMQEYREVRMKRQDAELAQSLEQEEQAERFVLIETPYLPVESERSLRKLIVWAFMLALGGGGAIAFLKEFLDDKVYGPGMVTALTGQPPLVVMPYLKNSNEKPVPRQLPYGYG